MPVGIGKEYRHLPVVQGDLKPPAGGAADLRGIRFGGRDPGKMDDSAFHRIVDHLGGSRRGYRKVRKGVKRRLERHMAGLGCRTVAAYLEALERSAADMEAARRLMTVPISRFFRDRVLWAQLRDPVLPTLLDRFGVPLHVWSAGCACGEEAYSFRILWEKMLPGVPPRILATDLMPERIERAEAGLYPRGSMKEIPEALLPRWFEELEGGRGYRVREAVRSGIRWQCLDIEAIECRSPFHIVFLRNSILTYDRPPKRDRVLARVRECVARGGVVIVGSHERLPDPDGRFERWFPWIYRLR
ncbi:MAG: CheR family methyltransferase [Desulfobacterales bacterium]